MKITFYQQSVTETKEKHVERGCVSNGSVEHAGASYQPCFVESSRERMGMPGKQGEKGKSLIELQQEASHIDVGVQQDYMTLMSNTMSEEDYAKLQEEGFDFGGLEPEEAVTIVDKIKAELVRSGKQIAGYTDDLDLETLAAALGSQALAQAVVDSFRAADIPLTEENMSAVSRAWDMAAQLKPLEEGSLSYLIDNELEGEIWNLYLAENSGAGKASGNVPAFFAEDVQGYYTRSAGAAQMNEMTAQIDKVLEQSGREVNEENRNRAVWLLQKGLPLTEESLARLEELRGIELPVKEERFAESAATAVTEGKNPLHGSLTGSSESVYQKAVRMDAYYHSQEVWENTVGDITARRQLEEIRLRMTAEVNVKLLKSGFSIDTAPMEELVEALKAVEKELADCYFPQDVEAVQKYQTYCAANTAIAELPALPAEVLGAFAEGQATATLEEFHRDGRGLQETYERAGKSYEALMTAPRRDMGDSIRKAFANVDDILKDLGQELTEENRRAARILGYNRMEMTVYNLDRVREADRQVQTMVEKLTPAATLKMIRDGVNPLEKSFGELEAYFDALPEEYREEAESYSRFLYGLEQNKAVTAEERESYIGIYRLVRQIEKSDGAVIGALVNTNAELHFSNLLSAVRSGKVKSLDIKVSDELGSVSELIQKGESISEQIAKAFVGSLKDALTEVSYREEAQQEYDRQQLEQYRSAVASADSEVTAMLARGELSASGENLFAAEALVQNAENLFAAADRKGAVKRGSTGGADGSTSAGETDGRTEENEKAGNSSTRLWEKLENKQAFAEAYGEFTEAARAQTEEISLEQTDNSIDVRGMQLVHKQLTVMSSLAKQEEYFIPMYVGDVLTRVHLTFDRSGQEKGTVRIGVNLSEGEHTEERLHLEAQLSMENGVLQGIFSGQTREAVMKLEKIADTFKEEASHSWTVGSVSVVSTTARIQRADAESAGEGYVENAELYRMAKVFLHAVQEGVRTDENQL